MDCLSVLQGDDGPLPDGPERIYLSVQEVSGDSEKSDLAGLLCWESFANEAESDVKLSAEYERKATALCESGVSSLWLTGFTSLCQARSAVLSVRNCGLPVYICLVTGDEAGTTLDGDSLLACLLCLQGLGIKGFGLSGSFESIESEISKLLPYVSVELLALPYLDRPIEVWTACLRWLFEIGIRAIGLYSCEDAFTESTEMMCRIYDHMAVKYPPRTEDAPILLADSRTVFYLEEDFSLSEPIECEVDMLAQFVAYEDAGYYALLIEVHDNAAAENFALNRDMTRTAVCFLSDDPESLEHSLRAYVGRALVDSRSEIPETELLDIAGRYGAMIR